MKDWNREITTKTLNILNKNNLSFVYISPSCMDFVVQKNKIVIIIIFFWMRPNNK